MRALFFFETMLTPLIIAVLYWLLLASVLISSVVLIFTGHFIQGLLSLIFGAIGVRIWCELLIVVFKINENLQKIASRE